MKPTSKSLHCFLLACVLWLGQAFPANAFYLSATRATQSNPRDGISAAQSEPRLQLVVLPFQDESGAGASIELCKWLSEDLSKMLYGATNRKLSTRFNEMRDNFGNAVSTSNWDVKRLVMHGQKMSAQFVIRPGIVSITTGKSYGVTEIQVKAYADVVSVEPAGIKRLEVQELGNLKDATLLNPSDLVNPSRDDFFRSPAYRVFHYVIDSLAKRISQAIESGSLETALPDEPRDVPPDDPATNPPSSVNPGTDVGDATEDAQGATADEELQQLIAQAQECLNSANATTEKINALIVALNALKAALENKARLLENGNLAQAESADQEIETQRQELQNAESDILPSTDAPSADAPSTGEAIPSDTGQSASGTSRWDTWFTRITQAADFALNFIDRIKQMRSQYRDLTQDQSLPPDSVEGAPINPSEEELELASGTIGETDNTTQGSLRIEQQRPHTAMLRLSDVENANRIDTANGVLNQPWLSVAAAVRFATPLFGRFRPMVGAEVIEPVSGLSTRTNSSGFYSFRVPARSTKLIVKAGGRQIAELRITIVRGRGASADFTLNANSSSSSTQSARILPAVVAASRESVNTGMIRGAVQDSQGRGVARALVELQGLAMARTDSQGKFVFTRVPAGNQRLIVQARDSAPKPEPVRVAANRVTEKEIRLDLISKTPRDRVMLPGANTMVRGTVSDTQNRPVAGAKVSAIFMSGTASAVAMKTRTDGSFEMKDLKAGEYRILVDKAGFDSASQNISLRIGSAQRRDFFLKVVSSTFTGAAENTIKSQLVELRGQVRATNRAPIPNALVEFKSNSKMLGNRTVRTDARGEFVLKLFQGNYEVKVKQNGFREERRAVNLQSRNLARQDFELTATSVTGGNREETRSPENREVARKTGQLNGRVVDDKTGKPISEATVSVAGRSDRTDASGSYTLTNLEPDTYRVSVNRNGYESVNKNVEVQQGSSKTQNFELKPTPFGRSGELPVPHRTGQLTGRVVDDKTGKAIADAVVSAQGKTAKTDKSGNYSITELAQGNHSVKVAKDGYSNEAAQVTIQAGNSTRRDFDLQPKREEVRSLVEVPRPPNPLSQLTGRVMEEKTRRPIADATVSVDGRSARTDRDGNFLITNLQSGKHKVEVRRNGYENENKNIEIRQGSSNRQDFELKPRGGIQQGQTRQPIPNIPSQENGELTGRVLDAKTGKAIAGAVVSIQGRNDVTDRSGNYSINNLRPGNVEVRISSNGYASAREGVRIESARRSREDFRLSPLSGSLKR